MLIAFRHSSSPHSPLTKESYTIGDWDLGKIGLCWLLYVTAYLQWFECNDVCITCTMYMYINLNSRSVGQHLMVE